MTDENVYVNKEKKLFLLILYAFDKGEGKEKVSKIEVDFYIDLYQNLEEDDLNYMKEEMLYNHKNCLEFLNGDYLHYFYNEKKNNETK